MKEPEGRRLGALLELALDPAHAGWDDDASLSQACNVAGAEDADE